MKILVKVALDSTSGYGNDGIGLVRALKALGAKVYIHPVGVTPPIPKDVAELLTIPYEPPFDAMIVHLDPLSLKLDTGVHRVVARTIAWSMWEWESLNVPGKTRLRKAMKDYDVFVAYDEVTAKAVEPHLPKRILRHTLQGGYWSEDWKYMDRDWFSTEEPFRYIMVGQLHQRKDPFAAIWAFNQLKAEHGDEFNAELHLKTNIMGLHPAIADAYEDVYVHYGYWPKAELLEFYRKAHVLLAPSRGEGKNLPALEAASSGMAVIATNWGGHTVWLNDAYAYPLNYSLTDSLGGVQAVADREHLKELMWHVYTHREEAKRKGELASRTLPPMCDWTVIARKMVEIIATTPSHRMGDTLG